MRWSERPHPDHGSVYQLRTDDGYWQISYPSRDREPAVGLAFAREAGGSSCQMPFDIGRFSSVGEAMLAVRVLESGCVASDIDRQLWELGAREYVAGKKMLDLRDKWGGGGGYFLVLTGVGLHESETGLEYQSCRDGGDTRFVSRLWTATEMDPNIRPLGVEDTYPVEMAVHLAILRERLAREPGRRGEPLSVEEFQRWERKAFQTELDAAEMEPAGGPTGP